MKLADMLKKMAACSAVGAMLVLAGCGGGGDSEPQAAGTSTGKFVDAAVAGLTYSSGSTTGTTAADGTFEYEVGETITFSVGGITLGTVTPKDIITPVDLVTGATDETDATVTNIARFLQTIDDNGDPSDGITIPEEAAAAAADLDINFGQTMVDFAADADVTAAIAAITAATTAGERPLVSTADAQAHLASNLIDLLSGTYKGTFSGEGSNGTFTVTIDSDGDVTGEGHDNVADVDFPITGTMSSNGEGAFGSAGIATFDAQINRDTGKISGTWEWLDASTGGTLTGTKQ